MSIHGNATRAGFRINRGLPNQLSWTIMAWVKWTSTPPAGQFIPVFYRCNNGPAPYLYFGSVNGALQMQIDNALDGIAGLTVTGQTLTLNRWYHLALTVKEPNAFAYVNGILDITAGTSAGGNFALTNDEIFAGIGDDTDAAVSRTAVSYIKVWDTTLTSDEIKQEMWYRDAVRKTDLWSVCYASTKRDVFDRSGHGRPWNIQGTPQTREDPQGVKVSAASLIDRFRYFTPGNVFTVEPVGALRFTGLANVSEAVAFTASGSLTINGLGYVFSNPQGLKGYIVPEAVYPRAFINPASTINYSNPLMQGLVSRWKITNNSGWRGGNTLRDLTGRFPGTFSSTPPTWRGNYGRPGGCGSLNFTGTEADFVTMSANLTFTDSAGSIFAWVRPASGLGQDVTIGVFSKYPNSNGTAPGGVGLAVYRGAPGSPYIVRVRLGGSDPNFNEFNGSSTVAEVSWSFIGVTWNSANAWIYVNGVAQQFSRTQALSFSTNNSPTIGRLNSGTNDGWTGELDDVIVFSRLLQPSEVSQLYTTTNLIKDRTLNYFPTTFFYTLDTPDWVESNNNGKVSLRGSADATWLPAITSTTYGLETYARGKIDPARPVNWRHPLNRKRQIWLLSVQNPGWTGGATFRDLTGRHHGTLLNGTTWTTSHGRIGGVGAVSLDGSDDMVQASVPTISAYPFTIGVWANVANTLDTNTAVNMTQDGAFGIQACIMVRSGVWAVVNRLDTTFDPAFGTTSVVTNTWYRLVAVFENRNSSKLYVNGKLEATLTIDKDFNFPVDTLLVGRFRTVDPTGAFPGYLDDAFMSTTAWTATEVAEDYKESKAGYPNALNYLPTFFFGSAGDTVIYEASGSLGVSGLASTAQDVSESLKQGGWFGDSGLSRYVRPTSPINWQHPLNKGLVARWRTVPNPGWRGGVTLRDLRGKYHGSLTGSPTTSGSHGGRGLIGSVDYNGSSQYADVSYAGLIPTGKFTFAAWIRLESYSPNGIGDFNQRVIFDTCAGTTYTDLHGLSVNGTQVNAFVNWVGGISANSRANIIGVGCGLNTWQRVVSTFDGTTLNLYQDGNLTASATLTTPLDAQPITNATIGRFVTFNGYWDGQIEDMVIWDRALSAAEVYEDLKIGRSETQATLNYLPTSAPASTVATDGSVAEWYGSFEKYVNPANPVKWQHPLNNGLVSWWKIIANPGWKGGYAARDLCGRSHGSPDVFQMAYWTTARGRRGGEGSWDFAVYGVNSRLTIPNTPTQSVSAITVSCWFRLNADLANDSYGALVCKPSSTTWTTPYAVWSLRYQKNATTGEVNVLTSWVNDGSVVANYAFGTTAITPGVWHHAAMTYDGNTLTIYLDGKQDGSQFIGAALSTSTQPILFGNSLGTNENLNGQLDDVRFHRRVLTGSEIYELYRSSQEPFSPGLNYLPSSMAVTSRYEAFHEANGSLSFRGQLPLAPYAAAGGDALSVDIVSPVNYNKSINQGLVLWTKVLPNSGWKGGKTFRDLTGRHHGTFGTNASVYPSWSTASGRPGGFGAITTVEANVNYVDFGDLAALKGTQNLSISVWMKRSYTGAKVGLAKSVSDTDRILLEYWSDANVYVALANGNVQYANVILNTNADLSWHHFVMTFDGTQTGDSNRLKLYIDGLQQSLNYQGVSVPSSTSTTSYPLRLGEAWNATAYSYMDGSYDDLRVYNRSVSATQVRELYRSGKELFSDTLNYTGRSFWASYSTSEFQYEASGSLALGGAADATLDTGVSGLFFGENVVTRTINVVNPINWNHSLNTGRAAWFKVSANSGWASKTVRDMVHPGRYDGTISGTSFLGTALRGGWGDGAVVCLHNAQDGVNFGAAPNLQYNQLTASVWVYSVSGSDGTPAGFLSGSGDWGWNFYVQGGPARLEIGTTGGVNDVFSTTNISDGWHRLAFTYDGGTAILYVDGKQENFFNTSGTIRYGSSPELWMGNRKDQYPLNGRVDDLAIWSRPLSAAEVMQDYVLSKSGYPGVINRLSFSLFSTSATAAQTDFTQEGSGALLLSGLASTTTTASIQAVGKLTLTGLAVTQTSAVVQGLGQLNLSGLASTQTSALIQPVGRLLLTGLASTSTTAQVQALGTITITGLATTQTTAIVQPTGVLRLTGLASTQTTALIQPTGALLLSGLAVTQVSGVVQPVGQLLFTGLATTQVTAVVQPLGKLILTGLASTQVTAVIQPVGAIILTGLASYVNTSIYLPFGQLSLTGLATTQVTAIIQPLGKLTISGLASTQVTAVIQPVGAITLTGLASYVNTSIYLPFGLLSISGIATEQVKVVVAALGTIRTTGLADVFASSESYPAAGGVIISGLATVTGSVAAIATGQLTISGLATTAVAAVIEPTGRLVVTGLGSYVTTAVVNGTGALLVTGVATEVVTVTTQAVGKLTLSGIENTTITLAHSPSGQLLMSGLASVAETVKYEPSGGLLLFGTADVSGLGTFAQDGSGRVTFLGLSTQKVSGTETATGQIMLSGLGTVVGSVAFAPAGRLVFTGFADVSVATSVEGLGQISLRGLASTTVSTQVIPVGRLTFAGLAVVTGTVVVSASGLLTLRGLATVVGTVAHSPAGQLRITGVGTAVSGFYHESAGRLFVSGSANVTEAVTYETSGRLRTLGVAVVTVTTSIDASGLLQTTGQGTVTGTIAQTATGSLHVSDGDVETYTTTHIEPAGKFTTSGTGDLMVQALIEPFGRLNVNGSTLPTTTMTAEGLGRLTATGLARVFSTAISAFDCEGGFFLFGDVVFAGDVRYYAYGPLALGGLSTQALRVLYDAATGLITIAGTGDAAVGFILNTAGRVELSGLATAFFGFGTREEGGARIRGRADASFSSVKMLPVAYAVGDIVVYGDEKLVVDAFYYRNRNVYYKLSNGLIVSERILVSPLEQTRLEKLHEKALKNLQRLNK